MEISCLQCLVSYQTLTRRSLFPDVANKVPSGLNAIWWTGVAVWQFHTHSQPVSASSSAVGVRGSRSPISKVTANNKIFIIIPMTNLLKLPLNFLKCYFKNIQSTSISSDFAYTIILDYQNTIIHSKPRLKTLFVTQTVKTLSYMMVLLPC